MTSAPVTHIPGLDPHERIWVAGHSGMVGGAVLRRLRAAGCTDLVTVTHAELDLTRQAAVEAFVAESRPALVFLCAARVGGILANDRQPADFLHDNLAIQGNVMQVCLRQGVERLVFLGSSCIYPRDCPQPIREEYLLTGPLEQTNRAYALAKIAGVEACRACNQQHGTRWLAAMPTNLYGIGDSYHPEHSHVLPALLRRYHEAVASGAGTVTHWGSGRPRRELLFSEDLADAVCFLAGVGAERVQSVLPADAPPMINVGTGSDLSIADLAGRVARLTGFTGETLWDGDRPDGTPRKLLDVSRLRALGWQASTPLDEGLAATCTDFRRRFVNG